MVKPHSPSNSERHIKFHVVDGEDCMIMVMTIDVNTDEDVNDDDDDDLGVEPTVQLATSC